VAEEKLRYAEYTLQQTRLNMQRVENAEEDTEEDTE